MAILKVQNTINTVAGATTNAKAFASNVAAGNMIVVGITWITTARTCTVADDLGNTYATANAKNTNTGVAVQTFYAMNISAGACTVTATFNDTTNSRMVITEVSGLALTSALDQVNSTTGAGTSQDSGNITTTQANEFIYGFNAFGSSAGTTTESPTLTLLNKTVGQCAQYIIVNSPVTESSDTTTVNSVDWVASVCSFCEPRTTIALTGTATGSITEADIVTGGKTIILTLTNDTWIAAGALSFDAQRANIIAGLTSAQSEALGWNNVVKVLQAVTGVVRTSDTVVTITLDAFATYDITATETITVTVPATALTEGVAVVASPTFAITATAGGVVAQTIGFMTTKTKMW